MTMGGKLEGVSMGFTHSDAEQLAVMLRDELAPLFGKIQIAGSLRRRVVVVNDIDIVVLVPIQKEDRIIEVLAGLGFGKLKRGWQKASAAFDLGAKKIQVDLFATRDETAWWTELQTWTGPMKHNVMLRSRAKGLGIKFSQHGLYNVAGRRIPVDSEEEVYAKLGLRCPPPSERDNHVSRDALARIEL